MAAEPSQKPIHSIIIDTGPLIRNTVSISTIIASAEELYTTPAIISEIRDAATRSRVETTLKPFLNIRSPAPASYEAVSAFAKKTGDFALLSRQDLGILALAYEVHCEKHGGPWGLRSAPNEPLIKSPTETEKEGDGSGQKQGKKRTQRQGAMTVSPLPHDENPQPAVADDGWTQIPARSGGRRTRKTVPSKGPVKQPEIQSTHDHVDQEATEPELPTAQDTPTEQDPSVEQEGPVKKDDLPNQEMPNQEAPTQETPEQETDLVKQSLESEPPKQALPVEQQPPNEPLVTNSEPESVAPPVEEVFSNLQVSETAQQPTPPTSDDDSDGDWITPDNLTEHQAQDGGTQPLTSQNTQTSVATMTTDFAMQNVLLQMNLNLLSTNMQRIRKLRTSVLRCHACFLVTKEMDKQFCPRCGGPSLTRVSCSTSANGEFRIHLSKNFQHNTRGNRYSIPKPVAGTSNGKLAGKGGGKGGWGRDLVLAEDQKEYTKQIAEGKRMQTRDLMDEDYLPGILTGDRGRAGGKPKVGAGRNINARKRF